MLSRLLLVGYLAFWGMLGQLLLPQSWTWAWWGGLLVIWVGLTLWSDKFLLHFLQAREVSRAEWPLVHRVSRNQAFKLGVTAPALYTYNGFFARLFALHRGGRVVFVVERSVLEDADEDEIAALMFALTLQVREQVAGRATGALLGLALWWLPFLKLMGPLPGLAPLGQFLVAPVAGVWHRAGFAQSDVRRFYTAFARYPHEHGAFNRWVARHPQPRLQASPGRDFVFRASAASHGPREQLILALEGALHPWDLADGHA